jgi:hypothetical protein
MVYQKFYCSQEHFGGWRCILCSDIIDPTILKNRSDRSLPPKPRLVNGIPAYRLPAGRQDRQERAPYEMK